MPLFILALLGIGGYFLYKKTILGAVVNPNKQVPLTLPNGQVIMSNPSGSNTSSIPVSQPSTDSSSIFPPGTFSPGFGPPPPSTPQAPGQSISPTVSSNGLTPDNFGSSFPSDPNNTRPMADYTNSVSINSSDGINHAFFVYSYDMTKPILVYNFRINSYSTAPTSSAYW
jgi:hypothetical protein